MDFFHFAATNARAEFPAPAVPVFTPAPDRLCPTCQHVSWHRSTSPTGIQEFRCAQNHLFFVAPISDRA